uniref:Transcriptional regulator n=1 Tax=Brugia timori TaxID=42155 RepID=A0A0R3R6S3_9BILA
LLKKYFEYSKNIFCVSLWNASNPNYKQFEYKVNAMIKINLKNPYLK